MVSALIPLLIVGIVLVAIEIFMPGFGVIGFTGLTLIILSSIVTILFVPYGLAYVMGGMIFFGICLYFLIKWAKSRQLYGSLILKDILTQEKKEIDNYDKLVGREGVTAIPLKPFGSAIFNGVRIDVYSEGQFIPKGRAVTVVNVLNGRVIVKEMN